MDIAVYRTCKGRRGVAARAAALYTSATAVAFDQPQQPVLPAYLPFAIRIVVGSVAPKTAARQTGFKAPDAHQRGVLRRITGRATKCGCGNYGFCHTGDEALIYFGYAEARGR